MYCNNCMKEIDDNSIYCPFCGVTLKDDYSPRHLKPDTVLNNRYLADTNQSQAGFDTTVSNESADNINKPKQPDVNQNRQPDYDKYKTTVANRTYGNTRMIKDVNPNDFNMRKATKKSNSGNSYQPVKKKSNKQSDSKKRKSIVFRVVVIALAVVVAIIGIFAGVLIFNNKSSNSSISDIDLTDKIDNATTASLTFSVVAERFSYIDSDNKVHFYNLSGNKVKEISDYYVVDNSSYSMVTVSTGALCVGVKKDGTVQILTKEYSNWKKEVSNMFSELSAEIKNWTNIKQVAVYNNHIIGLKNDGSVVSAGKYESEQRNEPLNVEGWENIKSITTNRNETIGLKNDGTLVSTSDSFNYQDYNNIAALTQSIFSEYKNFLKKDGTLTIQNEKYGWGIAKGWNNIIQFCTTQRHLVGLKDDGTVLATGDNEGGRYNVSEWKNIVAIKACNDYTIGKKSDGTFVIATNNEKLKKSFEEVVNKR